MHVWGSVALPNLFDLFNREPRRFFAPATANTLSDLWRRAGNLHPRLLDGLPFFYNAVSPRSRGKKLGGILCAHVVASGFPGLFPRFHVAIAVDEAGWRGRCHDCRILYGYTVSGARSYEST